MTLHITSFLQFIQIFFPPFSRKHFSLLFFYSVALLVVYLACYFEHIYNSFPFFSVFSVLSPVLLLLFCFFSCVNFEHSYVDLALSMPPFTVH